MPGSKHIDRVTLLLVGLSAVLLQIALDDRQPGTGLPMLAVSVAIALASRFVLARRHTHGWSPASVAAVTLLGLLPFAADLVSRLLLSRGSPLEVQFAYMLRNLMLGLVAAQHLPRARGLAALASLFLVVVGFLWVTNAWTVTLLIVYAVAGMWWLVGTYWELLGGRFADETEPAAPVRPALLAIVVIALVSLAVAPFAARSTATTALDGFIPSSGGTRWNDPFAFGGVGNGDQMVAAEENASSFGPVESELFLESQMPSLYDAFNEFSEAVPRKRRRQRRAIPLAPSMMQTNHEKKGLTQKAAREFSTVRQPTERRSDVGDRLSKALLLVSGKTPMHLALETYDRWDGRSLIAAESTERLDAALRREEESGRRWLELSVLPPQEVFTASTETQVRVVNLKTDRVPTPPNTTAVTLRSLHAASMFKSASDGSLAMDVDHIPQLTVLRLRSALRDRGVEPGLAAVSPEGSSSVVGKIAAEWTAGVAPGWPQVAAVLDRLRTQYEHDQQAMIPESADDAVEHFLVDAKRGPDYLFAASAAVLLRSLGYETRVRSGLYASPQRYDRASRLTPVLLEDTHFWAEVRASQGVEILEDGVTRPGVWIAIEPTPGYDLLYAPESLLAIARRWAGSVLMAVAAHPISSLLSCFVGGLLLVKRRSILDAALVVAWPVGARLNGPRGVPRFTLRLLEWRAWLYGRSRPAGTPLGRWDALTGHADFVSAACWALYGEKTTIPLPPGSLHDACRRASRVAMHKTSISPPTA